MMKNIRQEFKKKVHGLPYNDAIKKEYFDSIKSKKNDIYEYTIKRV